MKKKDLLEKQLEGLFSDIVLPEPTARLRLGPPPTTEAALQLDQPSSISVPQAGNYRRLLNPNWLAWPIGALVILAFLLAGPRGWARPADTATPRATRATRAAAAHATALSATATATPTTTASATAVPRTPTVTGTPTRLSPTLESTPVTTTPEPTPTSKPTASATATATSEPALALMLTSTPPAPDPPRPAAPTRLLIPAINLEAPIMAVGREKLEVNGQTATTWAVPRTFAAGWHQTSAPPGQAGNTVLNGHQNIHGSVFKELGALEAGDEIIIYVADTTYHYRVVEKHVLEEEGQPLQVRVANARWIMPSDDERLTLVTCAPDSKRTQRLIVVAWPVQATSPVSE